MSVRRPIAIAALGGLLLLAGCAPMAWSRPDTSVAQLEADRTECRTIARRQAQDLAFRYRLLHPHRLFHRHHGRYVLDHDPFFDDDLDEPFFLRHDLERACLRAKGYRLVPVAPQS